MMVGFKLNAVKGTTTLPLSSNANENASSHGTESTSNNNIDSASFPRNLEPENKDFALIKFISTIVITILMRFWALAGAAILAILLLYWFYGGWIAFCLLWFATSGILYHAGDRLLYHPDQPPNSRLYVPSPKIFGLQHENLYIRTKDGVKINIVLIKQFTNPSEAPTLVFFHGNAGNIGHRLLNAKGLHKLGLNILMVEYRGYGLSEGTPSEDGLYLDAEAAMDFLLARPDINHNLILVFGRSLGGAVAIHLSSHPEYHKWIAAVILENTFTHIPEIAKILFNVWVIRCIPTWFYKNQFNSRQKISLVRVPTLFISGLADSLIPPWMMLDLYQLCSSSFKRLARFESGTHNDTWQCDKYFDTITHFLNEVSFTFKKEKQSSPSTSGLITIQMPPAVI